MRFGRAAAPILFAVAVAACSGATVASPSAATASAAAAAASSGAAGGGAYGAGDNGGAASQAASTGDLALAKTSLGNVLVGPTGRTLYMFTPDTATSSACTGSCAAAWPPLTGTLPSLAAGLDASHFASITRADGTKQVTFNGHPLYYYGGDKAAGETNGQGLNGKWYALGADGNAVK